MLNNKKVIDCVFILSPGKYIGGAERYVQNLAQELYAIYNVSVIIAVSHNQEFYLECRSTEIPTLYLGNTLKEASLILSCILNNSEVKAVVSSGYHSSYLVFLSRCRSLFHKRQCRFIDIKHGWITTNFSERFKTFIDRLLAFSYDCIVLVNPSMKKKLWYMSKKRLSFIPTGVTMQEKFKARKQKNFPFQIQILLIGRLSEEKRFGLILKALSHIQQIPWQVTVVGDGPEINNLKKIALEGAISHRITFVGYQRNVEQFYRDSDLLIISSINEGCPLIALEAMAHGVLVLSTDVGYMPTLLNEQKGFLVNKDITPKQLSEEIKNIVELNKVRTNRIRQNAWKYVCNHHNLKKSAEIFKNIINGDVKSIS